MRTSKGTRSVQGLRAARAVVTAAATATILAVPLGLAQAGAAVTHAVTTTDPVKVGLYGSQDPTFDGTYRQGLALLALTSAGVAPDPAAVTWLLDQQCADGSFEAFRTTLTTPCTAPSSTTFSGPDTNSTGLAVQALVALGKSAQATTAVSWLVAHQSTDGGWAYYPDGAAGNASDANSTALVVSALRAAGHALPTVGGLSGDDWLVAHQVGCSGAVGDRGAFTLGGAANDYATVQATLAAAGGFLPVAGAAPIPTDEPTTTCPPGGTLTAAQAADDAAGYLARRIQDNAGVIPDAFSPGKADLGSTANAVLALAATKHGGTQATAAMAALGSAQASFTTKAGADVPGALSLLVLADVATGGIPASFAGTDLVTRLAATRTVLAAAPTPTPTPTPSATPTAATPTPDPSVQGEQLPATGPASTTGALVGVGGVLLLVGGAMVGSAGVVRARARRPSGR
jgi:hypothetical protein